ncbi:Tegument antigen [Fasciola hepatica]|uniref:Tegument antigen n=1 Tax=Fasciola hepatica TaxID=6192 RepID=A0A4E0RX67_FASHE|nr:Tegument antigen [Fasciola hepatica]
MDPFLEMFYAVDTDGSEVITMNELREYVERNELDSTMVSRWRELFDPLNTGSITLESFCDVLGVMPDVARKSREEYTRSKPNVLPLGIKVIAAQMPIDQQILIAEETKQLVKSMGQPNSQQLTRQLKSALDETYGKTWHVIIVDGSYWITFSHVPDCSFHFQYEDRCYLIWKTNE